MNLLNYARKHTTGGITWHLMPYSTLSFQSVREQFAKIRAADTWSSAEYSFIWIESYALDIEFAAELTADEQRFADYWRDRPLSIADRWHAFAFLVHPDIADAFWLAFQATRNTAIESVTVVSEDERPNLSPASGES